METLIKILQLILSLSILVTIHEFGHFITAKIFGARVDKFYLFFNPYFSLIKKKVGETEYGLGWLPIGGYVKIAGMVDESMDTDALKEEPKSFEYRSKPAWQRLVMILAGVFMNVLLAWFIYSMVIFSTGDTYIASSDVKDGVMVLDKNLAEPIGLRSGDKIISIDGREYEKFFDTYQAILMGSEYTVERDGELITQKIPVDFINTFKENGELYFYYPRIPFIVGSISDSSTNAKSGLSVGDKIVAIGAEAIPYFDNASEVLSKYAGQSVMLQVERDTANVFINVQISQDGKIGVGIPSPAALGQHGIFSVVKKDYGFFSALGRGMVITKDKIVSYWVQLKKIVNPESQAYKSVGSVISMGSLFPGSWNWLAFWQLTAFLSIMLAVLNLLPIPALDGGHAVFILYEMITRRPPSQKVMEYAQMVGFALLLLLMVFAFGNDLFKLFFN